MSAAMETITRSEHASAAEIGERSYPRHYERSVAVAAPAATLFAELDEHVRLASHMTQSSVMMAGSTMNFAFDAAQGKVVGSKITMSGRMLGMDLFVEELVTERVPPFRKAWETIGRPRLLVVGHYRMGFAIEPDGDGSLLTVFIDYQLPATHAWLGRLFADIYARWCTDSMATGAAAAFRRTGGHLAHG